MIKTQYNAYPKYKSSDVEWIKETPEGWETKRIDWVMKYERNSTKIERLKGQEVFHYSIPTLQETGDGQIELADEISSDKILLSGGELLVSKLNPRKGMVLISETKNIPIVCSSEFIPLKPIKIDLKFSLYLYSSSIIKEKISSVVQSATFSHQRAKPRDISKQWFELPPISEQKAIAVFLDRETGRINSIIEKQKKMIELLKEKRSALITQAVTNGLDPKVKMKPSCVEWIDVIPEDWVEKRFCFLFSFTKGLSITKEDLLDEGVPCVNYGEIHSRYGFEVDPIKHSLKCVKKDYLQSNPKSLLKYGDFIFADTSEDIEGSGNFTYLNSNETAFAGYHTIITKPKTEFHYRYIAYLFDSSCYRSQIRSEVSGIKVYSITKTILKDTIVILPPPSEQKAIVDFLDGETAKIDIMMNNIEKQIDLLNEYKQSLITHAVTGKIDVRGEVDAQNS